MRGTFRLARVFGINIDIHITFLLLLGFFYLVLGLNGLVLILGVFFFVTVHELCHSLAALYFGIRVRKITLLPIGGIASMPKIPKKPHQELVISLAGPLSNLVVVAVFYYPLMMLLGRDSLMYPFKVLTGQAEYTGGFNVLAHIYWINLVLAFFNLLPAFPMDGGRVLRALLSIRMSYRDATRIAVRAGHIFALLFGYLGIVHGHIFLVIVAVFIYMAASGEGMQVDVQETIKEYSVKDVLPDSFATLRPDTPLSRVLELVFHTHQEDYPVVSDGDLKGVVTRRELVAGMHSRGKDASVEDIMRTDIKPVKADMRLNSARKKMQQLSTSALPVMRDGRVAGMVTMDDINRVYMIIHEQESG
jgi:Zn-dependent protease/CBS domain-containing protein